MPILKVCSGCLNVFPKLTNGRCKSCEKKERDLRGMNSDWERKSKAYRAVYPFCEGCGRTDNCTVHHRNGRAAGDDWTNLMTLCRSCHSKTEAEMQRAKRNGSHYDLHGTQGNI